MDARIDWAIEERVLRHYGLLGRGGSMGNALFAMSYWQLPEEARKTLDIIIQGGSFPYPNHDAHSFSDHFGDLPSNGEYLEFTVQTPGFLTRGKRRIVVRKNGMVFFTACHYRESRRKNDKRTTKRCNPSCC